MVEQRLPTVDSDDGSWGDILNQFLSKEHYDGDSNLVHGTSANGGHQNITIQPGGTAAGTEQIKFLSGGSKLTTPEAGAMEYVSTDNNLYFTPNATTPVRNRVVMENTTSSSSGDLLYRDATTGNFKQLGIGGTGNLLTVSSGAPAWTNTLSSATLDNTNSITVKDANFTIDNSTTTTKQAKFDASALTAGSPRTYTLPDVTDTLAAYSRDVAPLYSGRANLCIDGVFENNSVWANAFGVMSTAKAYNGKQSRLITASGAGTTTDRLTLTHDNVGNPLAVEFGTWGAVFSAVRIMRGASNTGNTSNLYLRVHYIDNGGTEQLMGTLTIPESSLSSSSWTLSSENFYLTGTASSWYYCTLEIDPAVTAGNQFYVDSAVVVDNGMLSGYQGTAPGGIANMTIGVSNNVLLKDTNFILEDDGDATKQATFQLSGLTTGHTTILNVPEVNGATTIVGDNIVQSLTHKDLTDATNTFPTFNQNTTGSAAKWTTARNLAGNSIDGSANVAFANKFIVQGTTDAGLSGAQFLGALATGIVKNTTSTGVLSIATVGTDYSAGTSALSTGIVKSTTGTGALSIATSGTDYAPATSGSSALKGNGSGGFSNATLNDVGAATADYSINSHKLTSLLDPTSAQDAATKNYVDTTDQIKPSVRVVTVGTETFTISSGNVTQISGTTIDGVPPGVGERILIKDAPASTGVGSLNSTQPGNGIYSVTSNTTNLSVSRVTDLTGSINPTGVVVFVEAGTLGATAGYAVSTPSNPSTAFTYGTTSMAWIKHGGGPGGGVGKYTSLIGNGASTAITVTHNLNTQDAVWSIRDASTNEFVDCDVVSTSTTTMTFTFQTAPASNAYKVVIIG